MACRSVLTTVAMSRSEHDSVVCIEAWQPRLLLCCTDTFAFSSSAIDTVPFSRHPMIMADA